MSHPRKLIRDYVAAEILAELVTVPVYVGKVWLEDQTDMPAVNILTGTDVRAESGAETAQPAGSPMLERWTLELTIEIRAIDRTSILDALDGYAASIQQRLATSLDWGGLVLQGRLDSVETEISRELEAPYGHTIMTYGVMYELDARSATGS